MNLYEIIPYFTANIGKDEEQNLGGMLLVVPPFFEKKKSLFIATPI